MDPIKEKTILDYASFDFEVKLINEVHKKDILFNVTHPGYKNNTLRRRYWREIAATLNTPIKICQTKWKILRCRYVTELKNNRILKIENEPIIYVNSTSRKSSKILANLEFLRKYVVEEEKSLHNDENGQLTEIKVEPINLNDEEQNVSSPKQFGLSPVPNTTTNTDPLNTKSEFPYKKYCTSHPTVSSHEKLKRKRSPSPKLELLPKTDDTTNKKSVHFFCAALAADMLNMSNVEQRRVRFEITKIMTEAEYKE